MNHPTHGLLGLSIVVGLSSLTLAGNLDPPSGMISPTLKTLDQVEPRIGIPASDTPATTYAITEPGSYYLEGDRLADDAGITVNASNVTIDLMGFSIIGDDAGAWDGVEIQTGTNIEIRNGTLRDFGRYGIHGATSNVRNIRVINARVVSNGNTGIYVSGVGGLIKECTTSLNGNHGMVTQRSYTIADCIVRANGSTGIYASHGNTILNNTVYFNSGSGIQTGNGCTVSHNTILDNSGTHGVITGSACVVTYNTQFNSQTGIKVTSGSVLIGNVANENERDGIYAISALVDQNACTGNNQVGGYANLSTAGTCVIGQNLAP